MASRAETKRYPDAPYRRFALAPGILGAIALLVGTAILDSDVFTIVRYAVSILALITGYFALRARAWWWAPPLLAIAVIWNPIVPFPFRGPWWQAAQYVASIVFVVVGVTVRERNTDDRNEQMRGARR